MKPLYDLLFICLIAFVFFLLAGIAEPYVFDLFPPQIASDITIEQWKGSFQKWAIIGVGTAFSASLLWYILAQWVFKINNPQAAGKRLIWALLALFPIGAIIAGVIGIKPAESDLALAYLFFVLNGLLCYYLATLLFSPFVI